MPPAREPKRGDSRPWALLVPLRALVDDVASLPGGAAVANTACYVIKPSDEQQTDFSSVPMIVSPADEQAVMEVASPLLDARLNKDYRRLLRRVATDGAEALEFLKGYHAAPYRAVAEALSRSGFRTCFGWSAGVAEALGEYERPLGDEALDKAIADIREWFVDHEASAIIQNLNGPATEDELAAVEDALGAPLPADLRALYRRYNGQLEITANLLFPSGAFLPLAQGLDDMKRAVDMHFSVMHGPGAKLDVDAPTSTPSRGVLTAAEQNTDWFCFAEMPNIHGMVHLRSGRVFEWIRGDEIRLVSPSFRQYLLDLADGLWADAYTLAGDPSLPGVEEEGFISARRHLGRG